MLFCRVTWMGWMPGAQGAAGWAAEAWGVRVVVVAMGEWGAGERGAMVAGDCSSLNGQSRDVCVE